MTENALDNKLEDISNPPSKHLGERMKSAALGAGAFSKLACGTISVNVFKILGEAVSVVLGLAFLWFLAINYVLAKGEVDISFLGRNAEIWFSEVFDGHDATVETLTLDWRAIDNAFLLKAGSISVKDETNIIIEKLGEFEAEIGVRAALTGKLEARRVRIDGGVVSVIRKKNGDFIAGLGAPEHVGSFGPVFETKKRNRRLPGTLPTIKLPKDLSAFDLTSGTVFVVDHQDEMKMTLQDAAVSYRRGDEGVSAKLSALVLPDTDTEEEVSPTPIEFLLTSGTDLAVVDVGLTLMNFVPADHAPKRGAFAKISNLNAPLNGLAKARISRAAGLETASLSASLGAGRLAFNGKSERIDALDIQADFDRKQNVVKISDLSLKTEHYGAEGEVLVRNVYNKRTAGLSAKLPIEIDLTSVSLDLRPVFEDLIRVDKVQTKATWNQSAKSVDLEDINFDFGTFAFFGTLSADLGEDKPLKGLQSNLSVRGDLQEADVLGLWPVKFIKGARDWIERSVISATLQNLTLKTDLKEEHFSGGELTDDDLEMRFDIKQADVKYISTMTPYVNASGSGWLKGRRAEINSVGGQVGAVKVLSGTVGFPKLFSEGALLEIELDAAGNASDMLDLIDEPPFQYPSKFGVVPSEISGFGTAHVKITRPLKVDFDRSLITYAAEGEFEGVDAPYGIGKHKITDGTLRVAVDETEMTIEGPVLVGPWRTNLAFKEVFDEGLTETNCKLEGPMTQTDLDGFGLGFRAYFGGVMQVSIEAFGAGINLREANIKADLTESDLNLHGLWSKPIGEASEMSVVMRRDAMDGSDYEDFEFSAPGLNAKGQIAFTNEFQLKEMNLTELEVEGVIKGTMSAQPNAESDAISVQIQGEYLNVSPFVKSMFSSKASEFKVPVDVMTQVDRLVLAESYSLSAAKLDFLNRGTGVERASLSGVTKDGNFFATIVPNEEDGGRLARVEVPDASAAAFSFFDLSNTTGGSMMVTADLPDAGKKGIVRGTVKVDDFILVRAPALAQILSLASLQGLADVMGGTGLTFQSLSVPFGWEDGNLSVRDVRASGPALGLTGNGEIDFNNDLLDLDGVLVPAYTANSVLADIPLIGDLFVGKKGEGIFALNYAVKGAMDQSQVSVNPLSALTPGFLRRIFDIQREELPDETQQIIESVRPAQLPEAKGSETLSFQSEPSSGSLPEVPK